MYADLKRMAGTLLSGTAEQSQVGNDGLVRKVTRRPVQCDGAELGPQADGGLALRFVRDGGAVEFTAGAAGLPGDWCDQDALVWAVQNGPVPVRCEASVLGGFGRIIRDACLAAGVRAEIRVRLVDLPLAQSKNAPYEPTAMRIRVRWGETWETEGQYCVAGNRWPGTERNSPVELVLVSLELVPVDRPGPRPVVDAFGQRIHGDWPTKVRDEDHLRSSIASEQRWLDETPPPPDRDGYGGFLRGPAFAASGYFRVEKDSAGRWWYVTPDGHSFWSIGTTGVRTTDCTVVTGREHLFERLPPHEGPLATVYAPCIIGELVNEPDKELIFFHRLNVLKKWGSLEAWRDHVLKRLRVWGFNTVANWSEPIMLEQQTIPHVRTLSSRIAGTPRVANGKMPDVFAPEWAQALDRSFSGIAAFASNPWLIGYFCDNEMAWGGLHGGAVIDSPAGSPVRQAFQAFVSGRFGSPAAVARAFGVAVERWEDLRTVDPGRFRLSDAATDCMHAFVGEYAERYFRIVTQTLKRHDPNHLYLGCRFVRAKPHRLICEAAGRYSDVVTVNCYDLWPRREPFGAWHAETGRPIQIGEHNLPLWSERMVPPPWAAFTPDERRRLYVEMIEKWASQPYAIGAHWFTYADMIGTGRPLGDGGNQPGGFVDVADQPHPELVAAAREATASICRWHADATPA